MTYKLEETLEEFLDVFENTNFNSLPGSCEICTNLSVTKDDFDFPDSITNIYKKKEGFDIARPWLLVGSLKLKNEKEIFFHFNAGCEDNGWCEWCEFFYHGSYDRKLTLFLAETLDECLEKFNEDMMKIKN
jgi:hypothetical protein